MSNVKKILSFSNNKGGVGKTTLSIQYTRYCESLKLKVCNIDLEYPGHSTSNFVHNNDVKAENSSIRLFEDEFTAEPFKVNEFLDVFVCNPALNQVDGKDFTAISIFRKNVLKIAENYDVVIIDPPPGLCTRLDCTLAVSDVVFTPIEPGDFSLTGFVELNKRMSFIKTSFNPGIGLPCVIFNKVNKSAKSPREIIEKMKSSLSGFTFFNDDLSFSQEVADSITFKKPIWVNYKYKQVADQWKNILKAVKDYTGV